MDTLSFIAMIFVMFICAQYNLNIFSALALAAYFIFLPTRWNLIVLGFFVVFLYFSLDAITMFWVYIVMALLAIAIITGFIIKRKQKDMGFGDLSSLFGGAGGGLH